MLRPLSPENVNEAPNKGNYGVYTVCRPRRTNAHWHRADTLKSQTINRQARTPWTRRVLGTFVVVCLNLALQPCAMAFGGAGEHDCMHCPPALAEEGAAHSMHRADDSNGSSAPCATGMSQCVVGDEINIDSRTPTVKVKDVPSDTLLAIAPANAVLTPAEYSASLPVSFVRPYLPGDPPPLNVLYCVYLD